MVPKSSRDMHKEGKNTSSQVCNRWQQYNVSMCRVYFYSNAEDLGLPPFVCWLALRGIKTMKLHMDAAVVNAEHISQFLSL